MLHGIRVFATVAVVLAHFYFNILVRPMLNPNMEDVQQFVGRYWFTFVMSALYAVDIFFFISAFLAGYLLLQKYQQQHKMNFVGLIFLRVLRMLPCVVALLLISTSFWNFVGRGPLYYEVGDAVQGSCLNEWGAVLTFTNSFLPFSQGPSCMGHLWFLSVDMVYF